MAWVRQVGGRLKSDDRYSSKLVYNNYPWPEAPTDKQRAAVEAAAQAVLDAREQFLPPKGTATLADLYDPLAMPPSLVKAHAALDRAVDLCCRPAPFTSERQRVEFLFALYEKLTAPLIPSAPKTRKPTVYDNAITPLCLSPPNRNITGDIPRQSQGGLLSLRRKRAETKQVRGLPQSACLGLPDRV